MRTRLKSLIVAVLLSLAVCAPNAARAPAAPSIPAALALRIDDAFRLGPEPPPPPPADLEDLLILARPLSQRRLRWHGMIQAGERVEASCIYLFSDGNATSIPFLIRALQLEPSAAGGQTNFARRACLDALQWITRQDLGPTTEAWETWWARRHR